MGQFVESYHEPISELNKEPIVAKEKLNREFIEIAGGSLVSCEHTVYMAFVYVYIYPAEICSFMRCSIALELSGTRKLCFFITE